MHQAYTTRVGWGPFPTELTDSSCGGNFPDGAPGSEIGKHLQEVSEGIGCVRDSDWVKGRARDRGYDRKEAEVTCVGRSGVWLADCSCRCGWLDIPVIQYGHMINNYGSINLTKLDVLDDLEEVWNCTGCTKLSFKLVD